MIMYGITYWLAADERFYNLTSLPTVDDILHVFHQEHMLLTLYIVYNYKIWKGKFASKLGNNL